MRILSSLPSRALAIVLALSMASRATAAEPTASLLVPVLRGSTAAPAWLTLALVTQEAPDGQVGDQALSSVANEAGRLLLIPLHFDLALDASVAGGAVLAVLFLGIFEGKLTPSCRWCVPGPIDASIRNALIWNNTNAANVASTVIATVIPVSIAAYLYFSAAGEGDKTAGLEDLLIATEAVALNQVLTETVKVAVARQRPFAYYGSTAGPMTPMSLSSQANLSFYSGHDSFAFASVSAGLTIALMRGYPGAWIIAAAGYPTAAFVGYLRMAADQHYFSDVLTGALVGGLVGFAIPYFFHNRNLTGPGSMRPAPGGVAFTF